MVAKTVDQLPGTGERPTDPDEKIWWEVCIRGRNEEELGAAKRRLFRIVRAAGGSVGASRLQFYLKEVFIPVFASVNMLNSSGALNDVVSISVMPRVTLSKSRPNPLEVAQATKFVDDLEWLVQAGWEVQFGKSSESRYVRLCSCGWSDADSERHNREKPADWEMFGQSTPELLTAAVGYSKTLGILPDSA